MSPVVTVGNGIDLIRINPAYSIDLKDAYRIRVSSDQGTFTCEAHYIEIIENPDYLVLECYNSKDTPSDVTTFSFFKVESISLAKSSERSLDLVVTQVRNSKNPV
jgi:hypothetical protein